MNDDTAQLLAVSEIFYSLDGEGPRAGLPAVFVRLFGCNLLCNYCDTRYASETLGRVMEVEEIVQEVQAFRCPNVTLTGGEPLLQKYSAALVRRLAESGMSVFAETNGSIDITPVQPYAKICMDWKTPSSGMSEKMRMANLGRLRECDVLKFVVREEDLSFVSNFLAQNPLSCPICPVYLSPVWGSIELPKLADFVKQYRGPNTLRMQLQMHKIIWGAEAKGV